MTDKTGCGQSTHLHYKRPSIDPISPIQVQVAQSAVFVFQRLSTRKHALKIFKGTFSKLNVFNAS